MSFSSFSKEGGTRIPALSSASSDSQNGRVVTLGMFILDTFKYLSEDGKEIEQKNANAKAARTQIGGGGTYFAIGARAFLPPTSIGQIVHYTRDTLPTDIIESLKRYDFPESSSRGSSDRQNDEASSKGQGMFHFELRQDGQGTTLAENIYQGQARDFRFLTPGQRVWPKDILESLFFSSDSGSGQSQGPSILHFLAYPERSKAIIHEIDEISKGNVNNGKGHDWWPDLIYEPFPSECTPSNLSAIAEVAPRLTVLSPNHVEALSLLGEIDSPFLSDEALERRFSKDQLRHAIEKTARRLSEIMGEQATARRGYERGVVIRCGKLGACIGRRNGNTNEIEVVWTEPYWKEGAQADFATHVVDVTGGGNAFLGGLGAGVKLTQGDLVKASLYGSVAASFAIEQDGPPTFKVGDNGTELWNGERPIDRLRSLESRIAPTRPAQARRPGSVRHQVLVCLDSLPRSEGIIDRLKALLTPNYTVQAITLSEIGTQPWTTHAALVVVSKQDLHRNTRALNRLKDFESEGSVLILSDEEEKDAPLSRSAIIDPDLFSAARSESDQVRTLEELGLAVPRDFETQDQVWKGMPRALLRPRQPLPLFLVGSPRLSRSPGEIIYGNSKILPHLVDQDGDKFLSDANDTLRIRDNNKDVVAAMSAARTTLDESDDVKTVYVTPHQEWSRPQTPLFDFERYWQTLSRCQQDREVAKDSVALGDIVLYGEAVTSTQTMLDKNPILVKGIPSPFVAMASFQLSGRGRGSNQWLSPPGCLQFSVLVDFPTGFPADKIAFAQYLMALAVCQALDEDGKLGVRIKWPNDIYAEAHGLPNAKHGEKARAKIGGILVNSSMVEGRWRLIIGTGVNILNELPTTSFEQLVDLYNRRSSIEKRRPLPTMEDAFARIMASFEPLWQQFVKERSFKSFLDEYLGRWLHNDQRVTLTTTEPPTELIVKSITLDAGLLRCERLQRSTLIQSPLERYLSSGYDGGNDDRTSSAMGSMSLNSSSSGGYVDLQPDGNSFDMMAGLIKKKV